jgi:hypothetical protein
MVTYAVGVSGDGRLTPAAGADIYSLPSNGRTIV